MPPTRVNAKTLRALLKNTGQADADPMRSKFKNVSLQTPDGFFQSKREYARWGELLLLQRGHAIRELRRQVTFSFDIYCVHICSYVADFVYWDIGAAHVVVEDAKGFVTPEYRIKRNLMLAVYGIEIREV